MVENCVQNHGDKTIFIVLQKGKVKTLNKFILGEKKVNTINLVKMHQIGFDLVLYYQTY